MSSALPPGTWPKASDEGYFKNLISGGRKHSWECSASDEGYFKNLISGGRKHSSECSALPSSGGRGHSCECSAPLGCYTRPPNSTLSLPFPGMTDTLYSITGYEGGSSYFPHPKDPMRRRRVAIDRDKIRGPDIHVVLQ